MIFEVKLPPGMARNGTKYQNRARWIDGNLVRFSQGTVRPVGGWRQLRDNAGSTQLVAGRPRALRAWYTLDGQAQLVIATHTGLYSWARRALVNITPGDLVAGPADSGDVSGAYGSGDYGAGTYGTGSGTTFTPAGVWHLDTFGDFLVAVTPSDGRVLLWNRDVLLDAAEIDADAPTNNWGVVVTPERFVMALGSSGDRRRVEWCDQENFAVWDGAAPAPGSQAGIFTLDGVGALMAGRRGNRETLLWTTEELFAARYIGLPFVYGFERVGADCGAISPQCMAMIGSRAVWMGRNGFFVYDGYTRPLPCDVHDLVFSDFEETQEIKVNCFTLSDLNEVWWLYPSRGSSEPNRYVIWNWEEGWWATGSLGNGRSAGHDRGPFPYPFAVAADGTIFEHEAGWARVDGGTAFVPFVESGPVQLGEGDRIIDVTYVIPDEKTGGQVLFSAITSLFPNAPETVRGPFEARSPTSVRWTARQIRVRVTQRDDVDVEDWRFGVLRLDGQPGSRR